tara:strand:+ start:628 stop:1590 length:963 start_codon:yes stop_codon:yes gene_type:complete
MGKENEDNVLIEDDGPEEKEGIIIVEDDPSASAEPEDDNDNDDDRVTAEAADDDDDDSEREAIRERRRKEKVDRKERRETAIKRDKTELDFLRNRNDDLEKRISTQEQRAHNQELQGIDAAIAQANKEVGMAERVIAKAVENNNGNDVTKAMKYRDEAMNKAQQLHYNKQQASQVNTAPKVDDRTMSLAKQFMEDNPWYDSHGRDEDSAIVMAIDQSLSRDGYNPQTEEYWDELTARAARRLPERFDEDEVSRKPTKTARKARGGPAVGSGKEHAPNSTRKEVYISPERKAALVEAGVWDDPVLRTRYVKRYAAYDKSNA